MLKRIKKAVLTVMVFSLCGCSGTADKKPAGENYTIYIGTDLHYISPQLTDYGPLFTEMIETGDGKLTEHTEEIADAFVETVLKERPDAVILSGDLTFNGEMLSLKDLKAKLDKLRDAGIKVLVIPGNHDIAYGFAARYEGYAVFKADQISQQQFREIMSGYGMDGALSKDSSSFSYVYELRDDLWLLALDCNTEAEPGSVSSGTLRWAELQLKKAKESGAHVISVTHQNVLPQSSMLADGFIISNASQVQSVLKSGGVQLNLSGHSHLQHVSQEDGLTDICTGSMSVYPLRYGILNIDKEGNAIYSKDHLDLLQDEAYERFTVRTREQTADLLEDRDIPDDLKKKMADFAVDMNTAYFSGELDPETDYRSMEEWKLWEQYAKDTFWYFYFNSMLDQ
ncbi:MAG: metallophosphoesterase [Solobacterium sp.]|nr:metallophosphoesterase [Solobacterium sp.]